MVRVMSVIEDRHAVVTGGATGIGAAIAAALVEAGARVTLIGRTEKTLAAKAAELGVRYEVADVTDRHRVSEAFADAVDEQGPIDILVNNAGIAEAIPFAKMSDVQWDRIIAVNLTGVFNCTSVAIDDMLENGFGRIVNVASIAALQGAAYIAAYSASKHGVIGLTRSLALEYARKDITVNAVCPGYVDTDIVSRAIENIMESTGRSKEEALAELVKTNPQGRLVQPEEVASTVLWICEQSWINGQAITINGGPL
jgi:NAD(P)-dependent dehydrogenase (short-subunit alcohol dehydrogenase family)